MKRRILEVLMAALVGLALLEGCAPRADYTAKFVGYSDLEGGERVALVAPVQQLDDRQTAFTDIPDLEPGDLVLIHYTGKSWDGSQSAPEREVVSRAPGR